MTHNPEIKLTPKSKRDVEALLSSFPNQIVIQAPGRKFEIFILGSVLFGLGFLGTTNNNAYYVTLFILMVGVAFFFLIIAQIIKGPPTLILNEQYFSKSTLFRHITYKWDIVNNITPLYNKNGNSIFSKLPREIGIVLTVDDHQKKEVLIADTYGFALENFSRLMIGWRERALKMSTHSNEHQ